MIARLSGLSPALLLQSGDIYAIIRVLPAGAGRESGAPCVGKRGGASADRGLPAQRCQPGKRGFPRRARFAGDHSFSGADASAATRRWRRYRGHRLRQDPADDFGTVRFARPCRM